MKKRCSILALAVLVVSLFGCRTPITYSEAELGQILLPGTARDQIDAKFGKPWHEHPTSEGKAMATYIFPNYGIHFKRYISGFGVVYTNNQVEYFRPFYSDEVKHNL